ncbi:MAG TPA: 2-oxoglutarate dehydrogenase E1 component [Tepidisphaeraceae bacterium]|jgi:2-oxoglutarate dehydrogenase E1 component|nr:2-oxoglutarate dehydrogenase E1 component [Tepidisphaeraceae bacterium]
MQRFDFFHRANLDYIDQLYQQYQRDPESLDETWRAYFAGFDAAGGRAWTTAGAPITIGLHKLVHTYREVGHFNAELDPLGRTRPPHPLLELSQFNITESDLDRIVGSADFCGTTDGTLRDLLQKLKDTYTRTIGVEFVNISDKQQRQWLCQRMEPILNRPAYTPEESRAILYQLVAAEEFEQWLHRKWPTTKRFSLEGSEALIPMLNMIVDDGAQIGVEEICMGTPHRGRLNVLAHVLNKPYEVLLSEFEGTIVHQDSQGDGDVKYHLGYANDRPTLHGKTIHIGLSPNPSHLELIDPVVEGIVRSKQLSRNDTERTKTIPLLIHGDASFTGQGIVLETLNLSELPGWRTGGTIHVIINNQIGFTTDPEEGRFTPYPTDVAKAIQAPIFHVNGDDPEAAVHAAKLAIEFREQFKCDVMIDLWCYRRHGHNEVDEPSFTQPLMYQQIAQHKSVRELYSDKLIGEGIITREQLDEMRKVARSRLDKAGEAAKEMRPRPKTVPINNLWRGLTRAPSDWSAKTAVPGETLAKIAESAANLPEGFTPHMKLARLMAQRLESVRKGDGIDWGCGEMLAIGSLLLDGSPVRFTGQDVQRGTFSHRHAVLHDYKTGAKLIPLNHLAEKQAKLTIMNTMLSELAVVGFEYGFSSGDPRNLVIWEAQFGDFVNGAQPIIDQFLAAAESKWQLMNGLVMLLPHGFEGQGPEHSNAYLERFLSLCAEDNLQVCVPTRPSQYFHALRRQLHRPFRKPLIAMMPKSLLRYPPSWSKLKDFTDATFQLLLDDPSGPDREAVRRVLFCSGKVFYSLAAARDKASLQNVAIVRLEQLYPFPKKEVQSILARYNKAQEICWVQEEPRNRGAWQFMEDRLRDMLPDPAVLRYFGRDEAASPATGSFKAHEHEELELIGQALELGPTKAVLRSASQAPATAASQTPVSD